MATLATTTVKFKFKMQMRKKVYILPILGIAKNTFASAKKD